MRECGPGTVRKWRVGRHHHPRDPTRGDQATIDGTVCAVETSWAFGCVYVYYWWYCYAVATRRVVGLLVVLCFLLMVLFCCYDWARSWAFGCVMFIIDGIVCCWGRSSCWFFGCFSLFLFWNLIPNVACCPRAFMSMLYFTCIKNQVIEMASQNLATPGVPCPITAQRFFECMQDCGLMQGAAADAYEP